MTVFFACTVKPDNWPKIYSKENQNTWKWPSFLLHLFYWWRKNSQNSCPTATVLCTLELEVIVWNSAYVTTTNKKNTPCCKVFSLWLYQTDKGNSQYDLTDAKRKLNLPVARLHSYENKVLSTNDISSIKRVLIRKFVKFHIVVVQQQRQRNKQRNVMHVQSCCFFAN